MILHGISLAGFRTYADRVNIGPFDERITVIHAPNGTGKTTLLDGLYAGLLESHAVTGAKAEMAMRSANRDIVPAATIDFSTGGRTYRIEKRFLSGRSAKLFEFVDGSFTLLREGDSVTEFTRSLLHASAPGRGAIKSENYGLGAILWSPQGGAPLQPVKDEVLTMVRSRLGGEQTVSDIDDAVEAMAEGWFRTFYTGRTFVESTAANTADLPAVRKRADEAREALTRATAELDGIDALRAAVEEASQDEAHWNQKCVALDERVAELNVKLKAFEEASANASEAGGALKAAAERFDQADKAIRTIEKARVDLTVAERTEGECRDRLDVAIAAEDLARTSFEDASAASKTAATGLDAAREQSSIARDAQTFMTERLAAARYDEQITDAEVLAEKIWELRAHEARLLAPTAERLKSIQTKQRAIEKLRIQIEASVVRVIYTPAGSEGVVVSTGVIRKDGKAGGDAQIEIGGSPFVEFAIEGAGTIRASGPSESSDAIRTKLATAEYEFAELTREFGTDDLSELERRSGERAAIEIRLQTLLQGSTPDAESLEERRARLASSRAMVARLASRNPDWEISEPDAEALLSTATLSYEDASGAQEAADAATDVARENLKRATTERKDAATAHVKVKGACDTARGALSAFENDGFSDEQREGRRRDLGLELLGVKSRVETAQAALDALGADPRGEHTDVRGELEAARAEQRAAEVRGARTKALLDARSTAGCYDAVARAEATLTEAKDRLRDTAAEAAAAKLLHEVFASVKAEREQHYLVPVRRRTAELYARVANAPVADVAFNRNLTLEGMMLGSTLLETTLSGGEVEQLNMVGRLALADLLNQGERQLVVLDDSLSVTDPRRFSRFLGIVREFSQDRMQFVITTCDKARYVSLTDATFIDLEQVRRPVALAS